MPGHSILLYVPGHCFERLFYAGFFRRWGYIKGVGGDASVNFSYFIECQRVVVVLMSVLCWYRAGFVSVSYRFCAGFMHISCRSHAHSMYVPCMLVPGRGCMICCLVAGGRLAMVQSSDMGGE